MTSGGAPDSASPFRLREPEGSVDWIEWDFRHGDLRDLTGAGLELVAVGGASWRPDETAGGGIHFDGLDDHLRIPAESVGPLDVARTGDTVSMIALVRRDGFDTGFVAGMWQEDDADPRRQYGLFVSLPTYGGAQQVIGHVSADGRPSRRLPYSRDYAASARMVRPGAWRVIGFSYDGRDVVAYLDGLADGRPSFTEVGPPLGEARSYSKNPYRYERGLNRSTTSDFTVGAVRLSDGMGNLFAGDIARLAVAPTVLDPGAMMEVARRWTPEGRPLLDLDFYRPPFAVPARHGGSDADPWPVAAFGLRGDGAVHADGLHLDGTVALGRLPPGRVELDAVGNVRLVATGADSALSGAGVVRAVRVWAP